MREEKSPPIVNDMSEFDDRDLVRESLKGNKDAYGQLVLKYQKRVYRFILMLLGNVDATEDIVQEAFIKGYLAMKEFDTERPFYPWIATIARNLAINQIHRQEWEKPISEMGDLILEQPHHDASPLEKLMDRENERRFLRAVISLPVQFRSVFALRMFEQMSYEDIAAYLNISAGTVDSRLHRAREKLIEILKDAL